MPGGLNLGTAVVKTIMDLGGISEGMKQAEGMMVSAAVGMGKAGKFLTAGLTLPLAAAGTAAFGAALNFDKAMTGVNAVVKLSGEEWNKYKQEILEFSATTSKTSVEVATSLRAIVSSGFDATDAMVLLRTSVDAAGNMMAETETTTRAFVATIRAFGMEADDVEHVADALETAATQSSLQFEELANSIGLVVGMAAGAGIEFETTTAAVMTMADAGFSASESATQLRAILSGLMKPSTELQEVFEEMGYSSGEAALEALGFAGVIEKIGEAAGGSTEAMYALFPRQRAVMGMFSLLADGGANFASSLDEVAAASDGAGEHARMADIRHLSWSYTFDRLKGNVEVFGVTLGNVLAPAVMDIAESVKDFTQGLAEADTATLEFGIKIAGLVMVIGPTLMITAKLIVVTKKFVVLVKGIPMALAAAKTVFVTFEAVVQGAAVANSAFLATLAPLLLPLAAVAAAVVAIVMVVKTYNQIVEGAAEVQSTWSAFMEDQVEVAGSAVELVDEYTAAQDRVTQSLENANPAARLFIEKQEVMHANTGELHDALLETATSYEDYTQAVLTANEAIKETARFGGPRELIALVDVATFNETESALERQAAAVAHATEYWSQYADQFADAAIDTTNLTGEIEDATQALGMMTSALQAVGLAEEEQVQIARAAALALGEGSQLAFLQEDALLLLAQAYESGVVSQESYVTAAQAVLGVLSDTDAGYALVRQAVDEATAGMFDLEGSTEGIPGRMYDIATAAVAAADASEASAMEQESAWESFANSLSSAMDSVLAASKAGGDALAALQTDLNKMESKYLSDRSTMTSSHHADEAKAVEEFQRRQAAAAAAHLLKMERMEEDHLARRQGFIDARDALGLVREDRRFERESSQAEEDFGISQSTEAGEFARTQAQREAEHKERVRVLETQYQEEKATRQIQGNEMIADQERVLAELLWKQTEAMLAMGQISTDQAMGMKAAIVDAYGLVIDETQVSTDALLAMMSDWATGGATSVGEIVGFLQNVGAETDALMQAEARNITDSITNWQSMALGVGVEATGMVENTNLLEQSEGDLAEKTAQMSAIGTESWQTLGMQIGQTVPVAVQHVNSLTQALYQLPSHVGVAITVTTSVPPDFEFGSPDFKWFYGLERLVDYARQNPVDVAVTGGGDLAANAVGALSVDGGMARGSGKVSVNQNFKFQGSFSAAEKEWFRREARQQAIDAYAEIMD